MDLKVGSNILQKIDYKQIVQEFTHFYYTKITSNPMELFTIGMINDHTRFNINGTIFKHNEIYTELNNMSFGTPLIIKIDTTNSMDSGSRRIDILVNGTMTKGSITKSFSQSFLLAYKDSWKIQNSILNIFI